MVEISRDGKRVYVTSSLYRRRRQRATHHRRVAPAPDAWAGARAARIWPGLVPVIVAAVFTAAGLATRLGCGCQEHAEQASGAATAAALAVHRFPEGAAIALAGSAAVALALAAHAFGEGLAAGALLSIVDAWACRNCRHVVSVRRCCAGGIFSALRTRRMVDAPIRWPSLSSSPWIRRYLHDSKC